MAGNTIVSDDEGTFVWVDEMEVEEEEREEPEGEAIEPEDSDEDDDEEDEDGDNEYEKDGFIVDDVEEEDDEADSDPEKQKKKKRESEKNYDLDEDDYEHLEDNGYQLSKVESKKFKRLKKAADNIVEDEQPKEEDDGDVGEYEDEFADFIVDEIWTNMDNQEGRLEEYPQWHCKRLMTYLAMSMNSCCNAKLQVERRNRHDETDERKERDIEDEFEPIVISEKYITKKDDLIREIDIPERMQISEKSTGPLPTDAMSITTEINWIVNQLGSGMVPLFSREGPELEIVKEEIKSFLKFIHVQKLDVPFIAMYKKEKCRSLLSDPDPQADKDQKNGQDKDEKNDPDQPCLKWHIMLILVLWAILELDRKWLLLQKRKSALQLYYNNRFQEERRSIYDETCLHLNQKLFNSITKSLKDAESEREINDVDLKFNLHFPPGDVGVDEGRFKRPKRKSQYSTCSKSGLWELASKFGYNSEEFGLLISLKKWRHVRRIFMDEAVVSTRPTADGRMSIDANHEFACIKWLKDKPLTRFDDAQWLVIQKAEEEKLIKVFVKLPARNHDKLTTDAHEYYRSDSVCKSAQFANDQQRKKNDQQRLEKFITDHQPHVIVLGAVNLSCDRLKDDIYKIIEENPRDVGHDMDDIKVVYANETLPHLYENSRISSDQIQQQSGNVKRAVALGRYLQNPLAMAATLCGPSREILSWKLGPLESFLTPDEKYGMVEQVMVDASNQVGMDVNLAISHEWLFAPLQFISRLGPRKAASLQRSLVRASSIYTRKELLSHSLGKKVFVNAVGFLHVHRSGNAASSSQFIDLLDDTRVHPESYGLAQEFAKDMYTTDAQDEGNNDEDMLEMAIEHKDTLNHIRLELIHGFQDWRRPYAKPSVDEAFYMLCGETEETLAEEAKIRAILSCRESDLRSDRSNEHKKMDEYYHEDFDSIETVKEKARKAKELAKKHFKSKMIVHPRFQNIRADEAMEMLSYKEHGESIIRPGSSGTSYLTLTLKIYKDVYAHKDIIEDGKENKGPGMLRLGKTLKIGEDVFEDLDEVMDRYVDPLVTHLKKMLEYRKFKEGGKAEVDESLRKEKMENPSRTVYSFGPSIRSVAAMVPMRSPATGGSSGWGGSGGWGDYL
nr:transcription elongation factor SPT6 homolog [Tanacetum cinerariifolium]